MTREQAAIANEEAFERDLSHLIAQDAGRWAAYHAGRRLGVFDTCEEAFVAASRPGTAWYDVFVRMILPEVELSSPASLSQAY